MSDKNDERANEERRAKFVKAGVAVGIGSAAIVVFSDKDSATGTARNLMKFFADESCGQCTPCRVGTEKALHLMKDTRWDKPLLNELSQAMMDASICGLGQAAPNPMLTVLKYFPKEVE